MPLPRKNASIDSVTYEISVDKKQFFVLFSYLYKCWYVRKDNAIVYTYLEAGNRDFKGPTADRAGDVLTHYFNLENQKKDG